MKRILFFVGVSLIMGNLLFAQESPAQSGVYVGVISFAANAEDITGGEPIYLDDEGKDRLLEILDGDYQKASVQGTSLYYAVHKALASLSQNQSKFPSDVDSVNLIVFTDGLDNNSTSVALEPIETEDFGEKLASDYLAYDKEQIASREVAGKPITAYSIGVKGADVSDADSFTAALQDLASDEANYFELTDFDQANDKFADIANDLTALTKKVTFTVKTPSYPVGTKVRVTFDVPSESNATEDAEGSQNYLEGEVAVKSRKYILANIVYGGDVSCSTVPSDASVNGAMDGTEVGYTFVDLKGFDPDVDDKTAVKQWSMSSGTSNWQVNSEYAVDGSTETITNYKSVVVYLALDSSTSLSDDDIDGVREAAKKFVQTVYDKTQGTPTAAAPEPEPEPDPEPVSSDVPEEDSSLRIGSTGPGGGIVFSISGNTYMEARQLSGTYNFNNARQAADDLVADGFDDWRAPSKDELDLIYQSKVITSGNFWSSTESTLVNAWDQNFSSGAQGDKGAKTTQRSALAIRSFNQE
ncbi:MAG: hypothetical protein LBE74_01055 [Treponema sp.]|jgi:hypothetical protein|nr:hypothetical protein [Treponema sp.]